MNDSAPSKKIRGVEFAQGEKFVLRGVDFYIVHLSKRGLVVRPTPLLSANAPAENAGAASRCFHRIVGMETSGFMESNLTRGKAS